MTRETLRNVFGVPVSGANFFGRESEFSSLRESIGRGEAVLVVGPRRSGKTSLLWRLRKTIGTQEEVKVLAFDFSVSRSPAEAALAILQEVVVDPDSSRLAGLSLKVSGIDPSNAGELEANWRGALPAVFQRLGAEPHRTLLLVDEAYPLYGADDDERGWSELLHALVTKTVEDERVSLVAALESTAFHSLLENAPSPWMDRCRVVQLTAWDAATISEFLMAARDAKGEGLDPALCRELGERTAPLSPYEAQLVAGALFEAPPDQRDPDEILAQVARQAGGADPRDYERSFSRPEDSEWAMRLLRDLARCGPGATIHDLAAGQPLARMAPIATRLIALGVLHRLEEGYAFASGLQRLFWTADAESSQ